MATAVHDIIEMYRSLSKEERQAVNQKLLEDQEFLEDARDIQLIRERENEPRRSFHSFIAEDKVNL